MNIIEIPNFADMLMESKDGPLERDRDQWPVLRTGGLNAIIRCIDSFLKFLNQKGLPPVLCFYFYPWEFIQMKISYHFGECTVIPDDFLTKSCGAKALKSLSEMIDYLKNIGGEFYMACELAGKQMF